MLCARVAWFVRFARVSLLQGVLAVDDQRFEFRVPVGAVKAHSGVALPHIWAQVDLRAGRGGLLIPREPGRGDAADTAITFPGPQHTLLQNARSQQQLRR